MLEEEDSQSELLDDGNAPSPDYWHQVTRYIGGLGVAALVIMGLIAVVLFLEIRRREASLPSPARLHKWQTRLIALPTSATYQAALKSYTTKLEKEGITVQMYPYTVLLSYPIFISARMTHPVLHDCAVYETPIAEDPTTANAADMPAYNGYSGSGSVEGELIYVNYGRHEDFELLDRLNVTVKDRIVIVRYGENFRGIKAMLAEERGAAGVLIFSDPDDDGYVRGPVYPDGPWRPPQAIQRGSVQFSQSTYPGDPTTPGRASIPGVERVPREKANIPNIPVQPISYADASVLLAQLSGTLPDPSWQGGLNFTYSLGPGPARFNLTVLMNYTYDQIWNVIGKIEGSGDPDKCVIVGNHRDAWNLGGRDPASGSASLLQLARVFGTMLKEGWRPYRTILIASWDAEEQGLIGSTEWVEELGTSLQESVLAYLNVDTGVAGYLFDAFTVPSLSGALRSAMALVRDPRPIASGGENKTLLEVAIADAQSSDSTATQPKFYDLGSGSDFTPFFQHLGLPAADFKFAGPYGVYHSIYDSYTWMEKFGDPNFLIGPTMTSFLGVLTLSFSDAQVLPFNYLDYAKRMLSGLLDIKLRMPLLNEIPLANAINNFGKAAETLQEHVASAVAMDMKGVVRERLEAFNARLVLAEQQFLYPGGLNGRPFFRHAIFAPGVYTGYEARIFPDLREAVDANDAVHAAEEIAKLVPLINAAASFLDKTRMN